MNKNEAVAVEVRLNNTVFQCVLEDGKWYNAKDTLSYCLQKVVGIQQTPQGALAFVVENIIVCEFCYKKNLDALAGLNFVEPSKIIKPTVNDRSILNSIKKKN